MFINKIFENLSEKKQIKFLEDCIKNLKDDDINKTILENKLNSIRNQEQTTSYVNKDYKDIFKVNH